MKEDDLPEIPAALANVKRLSSLVKTKSMFIRREQRSSSRLGGISMKWPPLNIVNPLTDKLHYRYTSRIESCGCFDADGNWIGSRSEIEVVVRLEVFREIKKTPKGAWIEVPFHGKKFVLDYGRKRYAWPTQELAWESYVARKQRQIRLLSRQIAAAEAAIEKGPPGDREIEKSFYLYLGSATRLS